MAFARGIDPAEVSALLAIADVLRTRLHEVATAHDLTPLQARVLGALDQPQTMRQLAQQLRCDPSNVTLLAERLERRGFVRREAAPVDRRSRLLVRTASGREAHLAFDRELHRLNPLVAMTEADLRTVRTVVDRALADTAEAPDPSPTASTGRAGSGGRPPDR